MKFPVSFVASFSLFLAPGLAQAQTTLATPPVSPTLPNEVITAPAQPSAGITEASARATFDQLEAARLATKEDTQQRAKAAGEASEAAAQVAWLSFDADHFDEAAKWFARRATLRQESYAAWKSTLNAQIVEAQNTRKTKVAEAKTDFDRRLWLGMTGIMQHIALTQMQILARQNFDSQTLLDVARRKLVIDREQLALAQNAPAPDPDKAKNVISKTLDVVSSLEDIASAQSEVAQWSEAEKTYAQAHAMRRALPPDTPGRDLAEALRPLAILRDAQVRSERRAPLLRTGAGDAN